jgi:hypothetical protein
MPHGNKTAYWHCARKELMKAIHVAAQMRAGGCMLILLAPLHRPKGYGAPNGSTIEAGNSCMSLEDAYVSTSVGIFVERCKAKDRNVPSSVGSSAAHPPHRIRYEFRVVLRSASRREATLSF